MWICPKCKREFKRVNQGHYCGKAAETVIAYIEAQPLVAQSHLTAMRNILQQCVPSIRERISWGMPFFEKDGRSLSFSACQKHISFYVGEESIHEFEERLTGFVTKKNAIYFPYEKELPTTLIIDIVKWYFHQSLFADLNGNQYKNLP